MRNFKIFIIFLSSIFLPYQVSQGCGPFEPGFQGYSFLNENIINTEATFAKYFLHFKDLYTAYDSIAKVQRDENLREWNERFCNIFKPAELREVIYRATPLEMKMLRNVTTGSRTDLPIKFNNNTFALHLRDKKCMEVIHYLIYAKECEPYVLPAVGWATPERDVGKMLILIKRGRQELKRMKSHYVRLRYLYQIVRLAHYAKEYALVLDLLKELKPKVHAHPSIIDYWIMGHEAGALRKLDRNVEASYLYSIIFAKCPSKRQSAYLSFYVKNDEEWNELVLMCKSDEERAMLYAIRANHDHSRVVEELEKIYEYDAGNDNLELLMVKEVYKLEKDLLGVDFNDNRLQNKRRFKIPRKEAGKYLLQLKKFVDKCILERKVVEPHVWKLASAYLTFLAGDYYEAEKEFAKLRKEISAKKEILHEQLSVFQLALKISSLSEDMDNEDENEVGDIIRENELYWKYKDFPDFVNDKLADVFLKKGMKGKAYRLHHTLHQLKINPQKEIIDDLLRICRKPDKTNLEEVLVKKDNLTTIENELLEMKATLLFKDGEIEAALEMFKQIPRNEREPNVRFNPFHEHIIDCVHCPMEDTLRYDQAGVIDEILKLEYSGRANLGSGSVYFYRLGNAYYNMSYFGDSWELMDFFRSGANWRYANAENKYFTYESELGNLENMDLSRARFYYEKALELAKSPEVAARACFMLAKCDLNEFYLDPQTKYNSWDNQIPVLSEEYFKYYGLLISQYADTKFYTQLIEECQFFKAYALN